MVWNIVGKRQAPAVRRESKAVDRRQQFLLLAVGQVPDHQPRRLGGPIPEPVENLPRIRRARKLGEERLGIAALDDRRHLARLGVHAEQALPVLLVGGGHQKRAAVGSPAYQLQVVDVRPEFALLLGTGGADDDPGLRPPGARDRLREIGQKPAVGRPVRRAVRTQEPLGQGRRGRPEAAPRQIQFGHVDFGQVRLKRVVVRALVGEPDRPDSPEVFLDQFRGAQRFAAGHLNGPGIQRARAVAGKQDGFSVRRPAQDEVVAPVLDQGTVAPCVCLRRHRQQKDVAIRRVLPRREVVDNVAPVRGEIHPQGKAPPQGFEDARGTIGHRHQRDLVATVLQGEQRQDVLAVPRPIDRLEVENGRVPIEDALPGAVQAD